MRRDSKNLGRIGDDLHPLGHGLNAGRDQVAHAHHLDHADAASADGDDLLKVTEGGLYRCRSAALPPEWWRLRHGEGHTIDFDVDQFHVGTLPFYFLMTAPNYIFPYRRRT
jgi:hypothetical protein